MWFKRFSGKKSEIDMAIDVPPVKLKGVGDGFWVTIDPSVPEEVLHEEVVKLFERLKHLAINAKVVIDVGEEEGHDPLIEGLKRLLKTRFDVGSVTRPVKKRSQAVEAQRQVDLSRGWLTQRSDALILTGRIRAGQKIETKRHLIIAGNVNPGAELTSQGNVIVLGSLQGRVHAGYPDNDEAFVIALDFNPTQVIIGGLVFSKVDASLKDRAIYASVENNKVTLQDYMATQPFGKVPWPTAI